jgi:hypothetical protein
MRRLLSANALLAVLSVGFSVYIVRQVTAPSGLPAPTRAAAAIAESVDPVAGAPAPPTFAYTMIASRNLFSPTRSDSLKASATLTAVGVPVNLFGVVMAGDRSIAYLEDPVTKRVFGYRLGDAVAGGTIRAIEADRIVLERLNQRLEVHLHDRSRGRQNLAAAVPAGEDSEAGGSVTTGRPNVAAAGPSSARPASGPLFLRPPVVRPGGVAPSRPSPTPGSIVPSVTLESLPKISGPGHVPANATSDNTSLR